MRECKEVKGIICDLEPQLSILDIKMYNDDGSKACDELKKSWYRKYFCSY